MTNLGNKHLPLGILLVHLLLLFWGMSYPGGSALQDRSVEIVAVKAAQIFPASFQRKGGPEDANIRSIDPKRWASREACIKTCSCYLTE